MKYKTVTQGIGAIALMVSAQATIAANWDFSGFIRQEGAYKISDGGRENYWNQQGNIYNGKSIPSVTAPLIGSTPSEFVRPADLEEDNDWNLMATRAEFDIDAKFSDNLKMFIKVRGFYQYDIYDDYGDPNHFEVGFRGDCATRLEVCGDDYMVDLPSFYFDYSKGGFWLRAGNQQIAWGESLFFRVLDTPNGLDLRRHSVLDWAAEEFSDKRVPAPGLRASYQFKNQWELEGFAQEFQPTIYANENTPYNVIASQFVVQQEAGFNDVDDEWNFGARLRGQIGELGLQFTATSRRNPDGVFRWTKSKVNPFQKAGFPQEVLDSEVPGLGGLTFDQFGGLLAQTPFEPLTGVGVYSSKEWFNYAGRSRLNGANLQQLLDDFPVAAILAKPITDAIGPIDNYFNASFLLDAFFSDAASGGLGDLRGHLDRRYKREEIYGFGMNYMFFGEPDSLIDQLLVRFEATYTPDKVFTDPSLGKDYLEDDEWVTSLVFEKYQRFSDSFPATFMVLQWMHKSESDLFGRHLDGYGANTDKSPPGGRDGFDALSFAFQQPFPNLIWRADFAVLWDPKGGYLIQPGLRWKPSEAWAVELFANFLGGDSDNKNTLSTLDWADEVAFRLTYQF
jgi:hypothetical protein